MRTIRCIILGLWTLFSFTSLIAQNQKLDSLLNLYHKTLPDSMRCRMILLIGKQYEYQLPDTAISWYNKIAEISGKAENKDEIFTYYSAKALLSVGWVECGYKGNYEKSVASINHAFLLFNKLAHTTKNKSIEISSKEGMASCYNNTGNVYLSQGMYDKALPLYLGALNEYESLGIKNGMTNCYNNIGLVHWNLGNFQEAEGYYLKALGIAEAYGEKNKMSNISMNLGLLLTSQISDNYEKSTKNDSIINRAIAFYLKSLKIAEETGDKNLISNCYNNIGFNFSKQGQYEKALDYYMKALKIKNELGDKSGIAALNANISAEYRLLSDSAAGSLSKFYLNSAITYGLLAIKVAREINSLPWENNVSKTLMRLYKKQGNYKKALEYSEIYMVSNDSMLSKEKTKSLAEAEAKFKAEKKQLEIDKLNKENELQQSELLRQKEIGSKQKIVIIFIILVLLLISVFTFFIIQRLRVTHQQKRIIEEQKLMVEETNTLLRKQNEEIHSQKEEIEGQRDEISAQRDMVTLQRDHIEKQKKEITDSINYARRIQQAVLPSHETARKLMGDHFILFKPKAIVSGDFYWITRIHEYLVIAVADCTGHGVPGGFMSMLGVSFLNEIVGKKEVLIASEIIDQLRDSIIDALKQKEATSEQKDGMDISICVINTADYSIQYAGAHNPLYIITQNGPSRESLTPITKPGDAKMNEAGFYEIKSDKQPVAIYDYMKPFTNHTAQLHKNDLIYLLSDGFEDQFGGPRQKKFMTKQLKELLLKNCEKSMDEQLKILECAFEEWKGDEDQIDDVTILGIKL